MSLKSTSIFTIIAIITSLHIIITPTHSQSLQQIDRNCRQSIARKFLIGYDTFDQHHILQYSGKGPGQLGNFDKCIDKNSGTKYILASNQISDNAFKCNSTSSAHPVPVPAIIQGPFYIGFCVPKECTPQSLCSLMYQPGQDFSALAQIFTPLYNINISFKEVNHSRLDLKSPYIIVGATVTIVILLFLIVMAIYGIFVELTPKCMENQRERKRLELKSGKMKKLCKLNDRKHGIIVNNNNNNKNSLGGNEKFGSSQILQHVGSVKSQLFTQQFRTDTIPEQDPSIQQREDLTSRSTKQLDEQQELQEIHNPKQSDPPIISSTFLVNAPTQKNKRPRGTIKKININDSKQYYSQFDQRAGLNRTLLESQGSFDQEDYDHLNIPLTQSVLSAQSAATSTSKAMKSPIKVTRITMTDQQVATLGIDSASPIPMRELPLWVRKTRAGRIMLAFSVVRNARLLFNQGRRHYHQDYTQNLKHFDGIRVLSFAWAIVGFTYFTAQTTIMSNVKLVNIQSPIISLVQTSSFVMSFIYGSRFAVSTFFFLSGLLQTYKGLKLLFQSAGPGGKNTRTKNWMLIGKLLLYRLYRLAFPVLITVLVYSFLFSWMIDGPVAQDLLQKHGVDAKYNKEWWVQILFVNNLVYTKQSPLKSNIFWFTSLIAQFSIINLLALPLYFLSWKGFYIFSLLLVVSSMIANIIYFSFTDNISICPSTVQQMSDLFLVEPWFRWGPLGLGMILGTMYLESQNSMVERIGSKYFKFMMHFFPRQVSYIFGFALTLIFVLVLISFEPDLKGEISGSHFWRGFYFMLAEPLFIFGLMLFIGPAFVGKARFWKTTLSGALFTVPARLTFSAFLVSPFLELAFFYSIRASYTLSFRNLTQLSIGVLLFSYIWAIPFHLLIEAPLIRLRPLIFGKYRSTKLARSTMRRMINSNNVGGLMYSNNSKQESLIDDYNKDAKITNLKNNRKISKDSQLNENNYGNEEIVEQEDDESGELREEFIKRIDNEQIRKGRKTGNFGPQFFKSKERERNFGSNQQQNELDQENQESQDDDEDNLDNQDQYVEDDDDDDDQDEQKQYELNQQNNNLADQNDEFEEEVTKLNKTNPHISSQQSFSRDLKVRGSTDRYKSELTFGE